MRKVRGKIRYAFLQKVLLLGVFTGLVFSCAEGIRLFPFPPPDAIRGSQHIGCKPEEPGRYSYAKGLENGGSGYVSRSKPEAGSHFPGALVKTALPRFVVTVFLEGGPLEFERLTPVTYASRRLPDKRGPPVFFIV